ncbi:MAG: irgA 2 [Proteobacteria bacterium]|nr:irgA 2 [Pseudomonadota bacterium]
MVRKFFLLCLFVPPPLAYGGDVDVGTRITAADIAAERPAGLTELLRQKVGLDVNNGSITMRGVRGIAIWVDGFSSSATELELIRPEQVELIEIFRGAASSRFGAEAMGGAIAVTTRRAGGRQNAAVNLTQGLDSRGGSYNRVGGSGERAELAWALLAESREDKGFRAVPHSPFPYQITVADEHGRGTSVDGKLAWNGSDVASSLNLKHSDNHSFFGRPNWAFDWQTDTARSQFSWKVNERWSLEAALGEDRYATAGVRDRGTGIDTAGLAADQWLTQNSRQLEASATLSWQDGGWQGRLGGSSIELSEQFSASDYASRALRAQADSLIRKEALFAAGELPLGAGRLELGLRRDWQRYVSSRVFDAGPPGQETRGGGVVKAATSPKIALSWPLGETLRLRGSLGSGFSPPQATQLYNGYVSAGSVTLANPSLKPERSTTADLALLGSMAGGNGGITLFATRWQDKIAVRILDYGSPVVQQTQNVGEVLAHGLETHWSQPLFERWQLNANYTYTRTRIVRDQSAPQLVGNALPDMPRHKANLALNYASTAGFSARAKWRLVGSAYTDEANTVVDSQGYRWKKSAYDVLDLAASWRAKSWEATLALDNVFDRDYVSGFFWHGEPRTLRGEFILRF